MKKVVNELHDIIMSSLVAKRWRVLSVWRKLISNYHQNLSPEGFYVLQSGSLIISISKYLSSIRMNNHPEINNL